MTDFRALCAELDALLNDIASTHPNLSKNGVNVINDLSDRARAAELLEQRHPTPIPLAERWPEFSDCDPEKRVWVWNPFLDHWKMSRVNPSVHTHWLPANDLPVPANV